MPIHDWTRVDAGDFHHFHHLWVVGVANFLNCGGLPTGFYAMLENAPIRPVSGLATQPDLYASRADRISVRHRHGEVVAIIEIVSPGNKSSQHALRSFVEKCRELLEKGVHLLIVDLFAPSARDPWGVHKAIWDEVEVKSFKPPPGPA